MSRKRNTVPTTKCHPTISVRTEALLDQLVPFGIYGHTKSEIAARFIEQALQTLVERPELEVPPDGAAPTPVPGPKLPRLTRPHRQARRARRKGRA